MLISIGGFMKPIALLMLPAVLAACALPAPNKVETYYGMPEEFGKLTNTAPLFSTDLGGRYAILLSKNTINTIDHLAYLKNHQASLPYTFANTLGDMNDPKFYVNGITKILKSRINNVTLASSLEDAKSRADFVIYLDFHCDWSGWTLDATCDHRLDIYDAKLTAVFMKIDKHSYISDNKGLFGNGSPLVALAKAREKVLLETKTELESKLANIR